jgi:hypothetical protein
METILVGKPEEKRPLGKPMHRLDLKGTKCEGVNWTQLTQHRLFRTWE